MFTSKKCSLIHHRNCSPAVGRVHSITVIPRMIHPFEAKQALRMAIALTGPDTQQVKFGFGTAECSHLCFIPLLPVTILTSLYCGLSDGLLKTAIDLIREFCVIISECCSKQLKTYVLHNLRHFVCISMLGVPSLLHLAHQLLIMLL